MRRMDRVSGSSARLVRRVGLTLGLGFLLGSNPLGAQPPSEGVVPLRTGFIPDPAVLVGFAEGTAGLEVSDPPECATGFFERSPTHVFAFETRVGFLRFYATSPGDLAMAVRDAEGHWHCNDDRFGRHPSVEGTWTAGRVEVWVGTHVAGERHEYQLRLTETRSMRPGVGPEGGDSGDETELARDAGFLVEAETGRFDGIRLRRGFLPDPRMLAGDSTLPEGQDGTDASIMGGACHGLTAHAPSHVITLLDDLDFFQLYLLPLSEDRWASDEAPGLSMMILRPDGTFACDDADEGLELSAASWAPGVYRVWIGTELGESPIPYRLGLSEIRRVR